MARVGTDSRIGRRRFATPTGHAGQRRPRGSLRVALTSVVVMSALAACTSSDDPPPTDATATSDVVLDAADQDTCDLLPADQLAEVLGEQTEASPVPSGGWTAGQCAWSGPATAFLLSVGTASSISAFDDATEPDAEAKLAAFADRQADAAQDLAGIGDGAVAGPAGVAARVGGTYLELEILSLSPEQAADVMRLAVDAVDGS